MPAPTNQNLSKRPFVWLGLLTVLTFAGPLVVFLVGKGGQSRFWPPDRPVEWIVILSILLIYSIVFIGCLVDASLILRRQRQAQEQPQAESTDEESGASASATVAEERH